MNILFKALIILLVLILFLVLMVLFYPFKYEVVLKHDKNDNTNLHIRYIIFYLSGYLIYKPRFDYELKLWKKVLINRTTNNLFKHKQNKNKKNNSIGDTEFINDKSINQELYESKKNIKKLFKSSIKLNERINKNKDYSIAEKTELSLKSENIIDELKNIIPSSKIYAIKKIIKECIYSLNVIKPNKCKLNIHYGNEEPFVVGVASAIVAPLYSLLGKDIAFRANFDSNKIYGKIVFTGRPILARLIAPIFRIMTDKKIKKSISSKKI